MADFHKIVNLFAAERVIDLNQLVAILGCIALGEERNLLGCAAKPGRYEPVVVVFGFVDFGRHAGQVFVACVGRQVFIGEFMGVIEYDIGHFETFVGECLVAEFPCGGAVGIDERPAFN